MLSDLERYTKTECGFVGLRDVRSKAKGDRMESFFLSETLKYLYLLFDIDNAVNHLDSNAVFSTEGHLLPLPFKYTTKKSVELFSNNRVCSNPSFLNTFKSYFEAPLDSVWTERCAEFVGILKSESRSESRSDDEDLVSELLYAVSVMYENILLILARLYIIRTAINILYNLLGNLIFY